MKPFNQAQTKFVMKGGSKNPSLKTVSIKYLSR
jgi:hypothetical protein